MVVKLFESLLIGASIAAIPGPIFFELIRRTLTVGMRNGVILVFGEFTANCALLSLIFFGVSHFLTDGTVRTILYIVGGCILFTVSFEALRLTERDIEASYKSDDTKLEREAFLAGFSISFTNPLLIALWISLSGSYLNALNSKSLAFVNIVLIAFGFLVFFVPLAWVVHKIRHKIPPPRVVLLSRVFGVVLICFGLLLLRKAAGS
ncbi:MAG TPA: LysE family transporter [Candidatus Saccharimonadales bacterium]|nr:LysE family transporter [Candidatus Saccharimonadales bacterium]